MTDIVNALLVEIEQRPLAVCGIGSNGFTRALLYVRDCQGIEQNARRPCCCTSRIDHHAQTSQTAHSLTISLSLQAPDKGRFGVVNAVAQPGQSASRKQQSCPFFDDTAPVGVGGKPAKCTQWNQ
ncbi:MAG: hypothetical protein WC830_09290 [Burkholderiales bacterium]